MIRVAILTKQSPLVGQDCALCRHPLAPGDGAVVCPVDGSRHHDHCWQANSNRCTAYGCAGAGELLAPGASAARSLPRGRAPRLPGHSKVRVLPSSSLGCAQSCLLLSIAVAIVLFAIGCFGIWAIADYLMLEWLNLPYRIPGPAANSSTYLVGMIAGVLSLINYL